MTLVPKSQSQPNIVETAKKPVSSVHTPVANSSSSSGDSFSFPNASSLWEESKSGTVLPTARFRHRNILFAVKRSDSCLRAFEFMLTHVIDLSDFSIDVVHLVCVVHFEPENAFAGHGFEFFMQQQTLSDTVKSIEKQRKSAANHAQKWMHRLEERLERLQTAYCTTALINFPKVNPGHHLVAYAEKNRCQLTVLGSRGLGQVRSIIAKSVSKYCMDRSKGPVLIIKE